MSWNVLSSTKRCFWSFPSDWMRQIRAPESYLRELSTRTWLEFPILDTLSDFIGVAVQNAPTETKTLSRLDSIEIETILTHLGFESKTRLWLSIVKKTLLPFFFLSVLLCRLCKSNQDNNSKERNILLFFFTLNKKHRGISSWPRALQRHNPKHLSPKCNQY